MLFSFVATLIFCIAVKVSCQSCRNYDVRLVGGMQTSEGRVEICSQGRWETICDNNWDINDASVVCRQLGYTPPVADSFGGAFFGQGTGAIAWTHTNCLGSEIRLVDCPRVTNGNCFHYEDAGVRCRGQLFTTTTLPEITLSVRTRATATSMLVSWSNNGVANSYNISLTREIIHFNGDTNQTFTITSAVPGTRTDIEYEDLRPAQSYRVCVTGHYGQRSVVDCVDDQTPFPEITPSVDSKEGAACYSVQIGAGLGFLTAVLVLLLIVAGVGLAYPRCIRSRMKDTKYFSNFSHFLDKNIYTAGQEVAGASPHPTVKKSTSVRYRPNLPAVPGKEEGEIELDENYEMMDGPPGKSPPTTTKPWRPPQDEEPPPIKPRAAPHAGKGKRRCPSPTGKGKPQHPLPTGKGKKPRCPSPSGSKTDCTEGKYYEMRAHSPSEDSAHLDYEVPKSPFHLDYEVPENSIDNIDTISQ